MTNTSEEREVKMGNVSDEHKHEPEKRELDNFSKMLEWRYNDAWAMHDKHLEEAERAAEQLLMEPRLSNLHAAGMHFMLALSPHEYVEHAKEAVRLYKEVLEEFQAKMSPEQKANTEKLLDAAKDVLKQARSDRKAIRREVKKALASGMTMSDIHDQQLKELNEQVDKQEGA